MKGGFQAKPGLGKEEIVWHIWVVSELQSNWKESCASFPSSFKLLILKKELLREHFDPCQFHPIPKSNQKVADNGILPIEINGKL